MKFELMRTTPVNVLRYLPRFLAKDEAFKRLQDCLSHEHERLRLDVIAMAKQCFVMSSTMSLDRWETVYGLPIKPNLDEELRRERIIAKIRGAQTSTKALMESNAERYCGRPVQIIEENERNVLRLSIDRSANDVEGLQKYIEEVKPAHLGTVFDFIVNVRGTTYLAGRVFEHRYESIMPTVNNEINATYYLSGGMAYVETRKEV